MTDREENVPSVAVVGPGGRRRGFNARAGLIAVLVGVWACLQIMGSGREVHERVLRCGEQLVTRATNVLQHVTVSAAAKAKIESVVFYDEPTVLFASADATDGQRNHDDDDDVFEGIAETEPVVVEGSFATAAEDLEVGSYVLQRIYVRKGSKITYKATSKESDRKLTMFVFDCEAHFGDFANPRQNFTRSRGALVRDVVMTGVPCVLTVDEALFAGRESSFTDLCIAATNNVASGTVDGALVGAVLPGLSLSVDVDFVRSDLQGSSLLCDDAQCEYDAFHAPEGSLYVVTQMKENCVPGKAAVVSVAVWYAPYVYCLAFALAAAVAYALLDLVLPSIFHLVEKPKAKEN